MPRKIVIPLNAVVSVELEGLQLEDLPARLVADRDRAKVGESRLRADRVVLGIDDRDGGARVLAGPGLEPGKLGVEPAPGTPRVALRHI